jgi:hypothetical protein
MRAYLAALCISILGGAAVCSAQTATDTAATANARPGYSSIYCAGFFTDNKVPDETRLISGEQSYYKVAFAQRNYVYINEGGDKGVKVGDRFMVVRPVADPAKAEWFKGQFKLTQAMGTHYLDAGQLRVVDVQPRVSVAEVVFSCNYMQRGDVVRPYEERPAPPYKEGTFEHFAPVSGKPVGTVVAAVDNAQAPGRGSTMYVNLGAAQGIKVGDYVRIFRYQGTTDMTAPIIKDYQYKMEGFGSTPVRYGAKDLPREVLGEGIVLNASRNAATVLVTFSSVEVFTGDSVEIE